jgi:hypothetical protein
MDTYEWKKTHAVGPQPTIYEWKNNRRAASSGRPPGLGEAFSLNSMAAEPVVPEADLARGLVPVRPRVRGHPAGGERVLVRLIYPGLATRG